MRGGSFELIITTGGSVSTEAAQKGFIPQRGFRVSCLAVTAWRVQGTPETRSRKDLFQPPVLDHDPKSYNPKALNPETPNRKLRLLGPLLSFSTEVHKSLVPPHMYYRLCACSSSSSRRRSRGRSRSRSRRSTSSSSSSCCSCCSQSLHVFLEVPKPRTLHLMSILWPNILGTLASKKVPRLEISSPTNEWCWI